MPKIIWNVGGQEKQKRKERSGDGPEDGNKTQSGEQGRKGEGGGCADDKI